MRHLSLAGFALAALALAGCADDRGQPAAPEAPPLDLSYVGFQLTIDVATGQVSVARPGTRATPGGPAFSLLGAEAVGIQATACTFSAIPGNTKLKRCAMQLSVTNRLDGIALVRPSFPMPPAGTNGILLFPYTASSQTLTGGTAVANGEWNNAPANFFNDFTSCAPSKASDCYRSETFPDPLLPGETSAGQTVGFDVPKAAQSASTFVVVAADLGRQATLAGTSTRCGTISFRTTSQNEDEYSVNVPGRPGAGSTGGDQGSNFKGFCGFDLGGLPGGAKVLSATLRMYQNHVTGTPYTSFGDLLADHMDLGAALDEDDYSASALDALGSLSSDTDLEYKSLDVTAAVLADIASNRSSSDFRVRFNGGSGDPTSVGFDGPADPNPPQLLVVYAQ